MDDLPSLYQRLYEITGPKCRTECRLPQSCCSPEYCEIAIEFAQEEGIELARTDHPKLPLMGPAGCTAPPHLRPMCTRHLCSINGLGMDRDPVFNRKYFRLIEQIDRLELEKYEPK
jgi:hypothetical protein